LKNFYAKISLFLKLNNAVAIGIVRYTTITNMLNHGLMKLILNSAEISLLIFLKDQHKNKEAPYSNI